MIAKVKLGNIVNIKNLVSAVSLVPYEVDLQVGSFVVNAKSILGVLGLPIGEIGIIKVNSDDSKVCTDLLEKLEKFNILIENDGPVIEKTTFSVCALGEMLIDFTMQGRNVQGQRLFAQNPGGAPANVLASMSKLGARTAFIGKAGNDMHGRYLKETLDNCAINSDGFTLSDEYFTTLAFVDIAENGEREFSFARNHGADKFLEKSDVPLDIIRNSGILHIGSISLTDEPVHSTTYFAVEKAKENGTVISYDPNYRASLWKNEKTAISNIREIVKYVDIMKISDEETELLTGVKDYKEASQILIDKGVKIVVVTLGKDGAFVRTATDGRYVKGYKAKAVDMTGAGDSFWGGFLYQLCRSGKGPDEITIDEAAQFADFGNAVASLCVEKYGAIPAMPEITEVENRINEQGVM